VIPATAAHGIFTLRGRVLLWLCYNAAHIFARLRAAASLLAGDDLEGQSGRRLHT
jgi:hypothetical protein